MQFLSKLINQFKLMLGERTQCTAILAVRPPLPPRFRIIGRQVQCSRREAAFAGVPASKLRIVFSWTTQSSGGRKGLAILAGTVDITIGWLGPRVRMARGGR